jgi:tetratricopeptide (TPR) repeat protein
MAILDLDVGLYSEDSPLALPETFLPFFPDHHSVLKSLEVAPMGVELGKMSFLSWVDFTLENPDEIWEVDRLNDTALFHYFCFIEENGKTPAFVVEVAAGEDQTQLRDYSLITDEADLESLRQGQPLYCLTTEWRREKLVRGLNERALANYDKNRLQEARQLIDEAIRLNGTANAYLFNNRGLICWKMGDTAGAKQDFLESIRLDKDNGDPYFNIGLICFDESDFDDALYYLRRAVDINPLDSQFLTELGHIYLELEKEDEALKQFAKAFENDPDNAQVDFHLGFYFLYKKRKPERAMQYYGSGLKKDPGDQLAMADHAVAYWLLGNRRKARAISRTLLKESSLKPYTLNRLVYLNTEMEDHETALELYQRAVSQDEQYEPEWLHYHAAIVLAKNGRTREALDVLHLAVRTGGEVVAKRALTEDGLEGLKTLPGFRKLVKSAEEPKRRRRKTQTN